MGVLAVVLTCLLAVDPSLQGDSRSPSPPAAPRPSVGDECTIGVASGKATEDGRPLLWKSRDATVFDQVVLSLRDGAIPYFALCDAGNAAAVAGGANQKGFAIVNAIAGDLPTGEQGPDNQGLMKQALQECATVADFAALLQRTGETGRRTQGSFAVIDAGGEAAVFEVTGREAARYDAGDLPLVRTNFTLGGGGQVGRERSTRAELLCGAPQARPLSTRFLLQQFVRDLEPPKSALAGPRDRLDCRQTLHRQSTVAALVVRGVKPAEDAGWTTMWACLGQPLFTPAVPLLPAAGALPRVVEGDPKSRICDLAQQVAARCYEPGPSTAVAAPGDTVSGPLKWLRVDVIPLIRRTVVFTEAELLARYEEAIAFWQKAAAAPRPAQLREFQQVMARLVVERLEELARPEPAQPKPAQPKPAQPEPARK